MNAGPRIAVVTGANRGIGLAVTRLLADRGFTVVMTARDAGRGEEARRRLAGSGAGDLVLRRLDVTRGEDAQALARWLKATWGHVDVIVNNAGIMSESRRAGDADPLAVSMTTVMENFNVNTLGAVRLVQALAPLMREGGRIVNMSSGMGQLSGMGGGRLGYRLSKAALNAATRVFANELGPRGISVYSVCPGWVQTRMGGERAPRDPEEGADTAVWLATASPAPESGRFYRNRKPLAW